MSDPTTSSSEATSTPPVLLLDDVGAGDDDGLDGEYGDGDGDGDDDYTPKRSVHVRVGALQIDVAGCSTSEAIALLKGAVDAATALHALGLDTKRIFNDQARGDQP